MFDRNTLIITYDSLRGEPRGPRKRGTPVVAGTLGACTDCTWCVQVCPTGIDIRKGLQYECIACAACVDACDRVMDRMGYARGLIRYTTQNPADQRPAALLRPRIILYAGLLTALLTAFGVSLALRSPVGLDVIRDRNVLYRLRDDGRVENVYSVRILNKTEQAHRFVLSVSGAGQLSLDPDPARFTLASGEVFPAAIRVRRPAYDPAGTALGSESLQVTVRAEDAPGLVAHTAARFLAPAR